MKKQTFLIAVFFAWSLNSTAQTILGIDVSHYQGTINWTQVKAAGYTFAWAKATEGTGVTDSQYLNNAVNGVSAGLYMGAYHFAHPDNNPTNAGAISEANYFLSVAQPYIVTCELPPVLDLEVNTPSLTNAQLTAWVQNWMNTVQAATGITPILYTTGSIANSLGSSLASYCHLWTADPDGSPTVAPSSTYLGVWYPNWSFKQYSWTGSVPNISGNVDLDSFNGSLAALQSLMGCTPAVCNTYYTTLPYSTSFETTWLMDSCSGGAQREPDKYWKSKIGGTSSSGNDYWHRDDYTGGDWTSTASGSFTPSASSGSYCARFHNAPATASTTGALDLYVNLSTAGAKQITFDFIHKESSPAPFSFDVLLSTNGGSTFPTTLLSITSASTSGWVAQTLTTSATSSASVLRFIATDKGIQDVGIDNLNIVLSSALSVAGTQTNVLCNGGLTGQANVTAMGGTSPYTYTWSPSGGNASTASGLAAGIYTCSITDASSLTASKVFTITQAPVLGITAIANPASVCSGSSGTLTANGSGGTAPYTYTWVAGPTNSVNVVSPSGTSVYTVNIKDANNCIKSQTVNLPVNVLPNITAASTASSFCSGQSTTLTASGAVSYTWNPGALPGNSVNVTPASSMVYSVTGANGFGCLNTQTISLTVNPNPAVTASSSSPSVCTGSSATLMASGATSFTWNPGALTGNNVVVTPAANTVYTVTGGTSGCTGQKTVALNVAPVPTIIAAASPTMICSGSSATLTASGASTYTWNPGTLTGANVVVTPTVTTTYTINGTGVNSCSNTATYTQTVNICTGVEAFGEAESRISIYPNPTTGRLTIELEKLNNGLSKIELINMLGQVIYQSFIDKTKSEIDIKYLPNGVYIFKAENNGGAKTIRIVKE